MYINDRIVYADDYGKTKLINVTSARPLDNYVLLLRFNTGENKTFDFSPKLKTDAFSRLRDKSIFNSVYVEHGVPKWLDGEIDIAPEYLYEYGRKVG